MDKRAAVVLAVIFGGLFLVLFGFLVLAWSAVRSTTTSGLDAELSTSTGPRVGVVELKGTVGGGERGIDADKVVKLLRKYDRDDDVRAVVVRIDSPGGEVAPSQEIYSALRNLRKKKKVVASLGNLAASGGYYIAAAADQIYASPGTLTGSIGVIWTHFNVRGLLEAVKIEETTIKAGKYKDTLSPYRPLNELDREELQAISEDTYGQFIRDVAEGRGLKEEEVRKLAEGRIYTGRRAKDLRLVDELGGFQDGQSGEPRMQMPPKDMVLSLRDLMRGAFQGAAAGVGDGVRGTAQGGGLQFLAPQLVE